MLIKQASGYGGLDSTPLARPGYYDKILEKVYERDFLPEITNTRIDERIMRCHQEVQIIKAPEVGEWRTYEENQEMIPNQITPNAICFKVCHAAYNAIKIDELTIHWACDRWAAWEEAFLNATYESYVAMQREWVLTAMLAEASEQNQGHYAGIYGNIDLGAPGNPIVMTPENLPFQLAKLQLVLAEQLQWREGQMFIVMPIQFRPILVQSNFANKAWVGDSCGGSCSVAVDGMWSQQLMGFKVIETIHAPSTVEADGSIGFFIIAGHQDAFAYAADIVQGRIVSNPKTFGLEYQMLAVWGGKMLYPEAIAVLYATFPMSA